jgi:DNA-binding NarL/FixJ family response regulator
MLVEKLHSSSGGFVVNEIASFVVEIKNRRVKSAENLSQREKEVLQLKEEGLNNQEVGKKLFISDDTVRNYVSKIRKKSERLPKSDRRENLSSKQKKKLQLQLVAAGLKYSDIADQLLTTESAIRGRQYRINAKAGGLKVKAVVWGINNGEIDTAKAVEGFNINLVVNLKKRELEILETIVNCKAIANSEIDSMFNMPVGTAKRHVTNMLNSTGTRNKAQLITLYMEAKKQKKLTVD